MKKKTPKLIKDLVSLDLALKDKKVHTFAIQLNGGVFSRKEIHLLKGNYCILNCIDNSYQTLSPGELFNENITNIGLAISKHSFFEI